MARKRSRITLKRVLVAVPLVAVLALGGGLAVAQVNDARAAERYVTAVATSGEVDQTLSGTGTVEAVPLASASFPTSAEVTSVLATVGDTVTAGQPLATIDATSLEDAVDSAALTLAQAREALEQAESAADSEDEEVAVSTAAGSTAAASGSTASGAGATAPTGGASSLPTGGSTGSSGTTGSAGSSGTPGSTGTPGPEGPDAAAQLTEAKEQVAAAQDDLTAVWQAFVASLSATAQVCATPTDDGSSDPEPSDPQPSDPATPDPEPSDSATPDPEPSGSAAPDPEPSGSAAPDPEPSDPATPSPEAEETATPESEPTLTPNVEQVNYTPESTSSRQDCIGALDGMAAQESAVAEAQAAVSAAVDAVLRIATDAVAQAAETPAASGVTQPSTSGGTQPSTTTGSASGAPGSSGASGLSGGSAAPAASAASGTPSSSGGSAANGGRQGSSQTVAQASAAVAQAELDLTSAQVALDRATLVAPASGVLAELPWKVGATASASDAVTVITTDARQLTVDIAETSIRTVRVGQPVQVTSATGTTVAGTVAAIGLQPTSGTTSYPVTISINEQSAAFAPGTSASVVITTASAADTVVVPVSAVALLDGSMGTVQTVGVDHQASTQRVTVGVVGSTTVQVTEGLDVGDRVVLSDTQQAIPSSTTGLRVGGGSSLTGGGVGPGR